MKSNLAATILVLACLGLGVVLWNQSKNHADQTRNLDDTIQSLTNTVASARSEAVKQAVSNEILRINLNTAQIHASNELTLEENKLMAISNDLAKAQYYALSHSNEVVRLQGRVAEQALQNGTLMTNLAEARFKASNDLAYAHISLDKAQSDAKSAAAATAAAAAAATAAIAVKDKQIADLEAKNADLDRQATNLLVSMTNLQAKADAAQKRLAITEGDNKLLMTEWNLIEAQKEDLQKKFNDVAALKAQVKTLQDSYAVARRVDWIERGLYEAIGKKGDQVLISPPLPSSPSPTNVSLTVEIHEGGAVKINAAAPTNAPSTNKPTARAPSTRSGQ